MLQAFGNLKGLLSSKKVVIDHTVFRLHYRFTALVLLLFCLVVTTKHYGGEPIKCTRSTEDHSDVVDSYCLITATFTTKSSYNATLRGEIPEMGLGQPKGSDDYRYHSYYQWIGFVLFFQAACFYLPHWLWKVLENDRLDWMLSGTKPSNFLSEDEMNQRQTMVMNFILKTWGKSRSSYAMKYMFCEVLCLVNVVCQAYGLNVLLDGQFTDYGVEVIKYSNSKDRDTMNPMTRVFPRVTSCLFQYSGPGGDVTKVNFLCILSLNVINEKIFLFEWFWLAILVTVTSCAIVFRAVTYALPFVRALEFQARFRHASPEYLATLVRSGSLDDWFLLHLIGQNMDDVYFDSFVRELCERFVREKPP